MSEGDKLNAAIGIVIGLASIFIAYLAYQISAKQDRYLEDERAKKAVLTIEMHESFVTEPGWRELVIHNSGTKAAVGVQWHLGWQEGFAPMLQIEYEQGVVPNVEIVGEQHTVMATNFIATPIWAEDKYSIARFRLRPGAPPTSMEFIWGARCDDGSYPLGDGPGRLLVGLK